MRLVCRPYYLEHPRCQEILSFVKSQPDCLSKNEIATKMITGYAPIRGCLPLLVGEGLLHASVKRAGSNTVTCYKS